MPRSSDRYHDDCAMDKMTRMLCSTLGLVEIAVATKGQTFVLDNLTKETTHWWEAHKELDRQRRMEEQLRAKEIALAKLTYEERKLLGL